MQEIGCDLFTCGPDEGSSNVFVGPLVVGQTYAVQVSVFRLQGDSCLAPPFNCRTAGDHKLRVTCDDAYSQCQLAIDPNIPGEGELSPEPPDARINDGCNQSPLHFAQLTCGQAVRGSIWYSAPTGERDTDWYRLVLPQPGTIEASIIAEFIPQVLILRPVNPDPCHAFAQAASNDPTGYVLCSIVPSTTSYEAAAGEYWVVVMPVLDPAVQYSTRPAYALTVNVTPCVAALGACCTGGACTLTTAAACGGAGQAFYGVGSTCLPDLCFACPASATPVGEVLNCAAPDGFPDSLNGGCGWNPGAPTFIDLGDAPTNDDPNVFVTRRCGTSGTFYDAPPPASTRNRRDNDCYRLNLGGASAGDWRRVRVTVETEFLAQMLNVNPDLGGNACATFAERIVADVTVQPGVETAVSACAVKRSLPPGQFNLYGDVWVIIRPRLLGPPRETPCGVRYYLGVQVQTWAQAGACCIGADCQMLTATDCVAAGGVPLALAECAAGLCGPAVRLGDSDCDGDVDFDDVDCFVAALGGEAAWSAHPHAAHGQAPTCPFSVNDANYDGAATFDDIDAFVLALGRACPQARRGPRADAPAARGWQCRAVACGAAGVGRRRPDAGPTRTQGLESWRGAETGPGTRLGRQRDRPARRSRMVLEQVPEPIKRPDVMRTR